MSTYFDVGVLTSISLDTHSFQLYFVQYQTVQLSLVQRTTKNELHYIVKLFGYLTAAWLTELLYIQTSSVVDMQNKWYFDIGEQIALSDPCVYITHSIR